MRRLPLLAWLLWATCAAACVAAAPEQAASGPSAQVALDAGAAPVPNSALGDEPVRGARGPEGAANPAAPASPGAGMDYPRVLLALGVVVGLILALRWVGRMFFPGAAGRGASRAVEVLSRSPLSPKQQVLLLRVGRRLVVVGDSGSQMNPLCEISDPDEIAALVGQLRDEKTAAPTRVFGAMFGKSRRGFESAEPAPAAETPAGLRDVEPEEREVASARDELSGLRDRVRLLAEQFNGA